MTPARLWAWLEEPAQVIRMEALRIFAPLFILGFMSRRFTYADEWIGDAGFRIPNLGHTDMRQPLYIPPLPSGLAWFIAAVLVCSGLAVAVGYKTRASAVVFAAVLVFVGLSDRLAAFTVSKISPVLMLAVAVGPSGTRLSVDAWLKRKAGGKRPRKMRKLGGLRFVQLFLPVFYCSSGIAKARGDWLTHQHLLWTHLHDTYQTAVSFLIASITPGWAFNILQGAVLGFEALAPIWFYYKQTRPYAFVFGMGMHFFIALMFGPVVWFGFLMMSLVFGAFAPEPLLEPLERLAERIERRRGPRAAQASAAPAAGAVEEGESSAENADPVSAANAEPGPAPDAGSGPAANAGPAAAENEGSGSAKNADRPAANADAGPAAGASSAAEESPGD